MDSNSSPNLPARIRERIAEVRASQGLVVGLTGAGLSAESGIPTFRGPDGFWTVGSREYSPQELATLATFVRHPEEVWSWYLYRMSMCWDAKPNLGHEWLAKFDRELEDRFHLITQNVDGLHRAAGHTSDRMSEVHGNIRYMRCLRECRIDHWPLPVALATPRRSREQPLSDEDRNLLRCPDCGHWARPHILWFDECYDDLNYDASRALTMATEADLLLVIGTSGATTLPTMAAQRCARNGGTLIEINVERTSFSTLADQSGGAHLQGSASTWLPILGSAWSEADS